MRCHPDAITVCAHAATHPAGPLIGYGILAAIMLVMVIVPGILLIRTIPVSDDAR